MASIYEIPEWTNINWTINDICSHGTTTKRFYYNLRGGYATPYVGSADWGGYTTYNTKVVPHFFWIPNYSASVSTEPKVEVIKFGDGYEQRTPQNISSELIKLNLAFDRRGENETSAIAHFLKTRAAVEAFAFMPPSPYASMKKFVCRSWDVTMEFQDNHSIKAVFEEVIE